MPFTTEALVPSSAVEDKNLPRFYSIHNCPYDRSEYGSRLIYMVVRQYSEDEILDMLLPENHPAAGNLSNDSCYRKYQRCFHKRDRHGRTLLHHACRWGYKELVFRILAHIKDHYFDPEYAYGPEGGGGRKMRDAKKIGDGVVETETKLLATKTRMDATTDCLVLDGGREGVNAFAHEVVDSAAEGFGLRVGMVERPSSTVVADTDHADGSSTGGAKKSSLSGSGAAGAGGNGSKKVTLLEHESPEKRAAENAAGADEDVVENESSPTPTDQPTPRFTLMVTPLADVEAGDPENAVTTRTTAPIILAEHTPGAPKPKAKPALKPSSPNHKKGREQQEEGFASDDELLPDRKEVNLLEIKDNRGLTPVCEAVCSDALGPCGSLSYRGTVDILRVRD